MARRLEASSGRLVRGWGPDGPGEDAGLLVDLGEARQGIDQVVRVRVEDRVDEGTVRGGRDDRRLEVGVGEDLAPAGLGVEPPQRRLVGEDELEPAPVVPRDGAHRLRTIEMPSAKPSSATSTRSSVVSRSLS